MVKEKLGQKEMIIVGIARYFHVLPYIISAIRNSSKIYSRGSTYSYAGAADLDP